MQALSEEVTALRPLPGQMRALTERVDALEPLPERVRTLSAQVSTLAGIIEVGIGAMREDIGEVRQRVTALERSQDVGS